MRIKTVGIILTDKKGSIVGENGTPTFMSLPKSVRPLDQAIMRRAISSQKNLVVVIGEQTFNEIKNRKLGDLLESLGCSVFVSNAKGVELYHSAQCSEPAKLWDYQEGEDTKEELRRIVYASAYTGTTSKRPATIVVLGGHSVYAAFNYHYTEIHHNHYTVDIGGNRQINVVGTDPRYAHYDANTSTEEAMMVATQSEVMYSDRDFVYYVH